MQTSKFFALISASISWNGISQWLQNFPYSIQGSWTFLMILGISSIMNVTLASSSHLVRTTLTIPDDTSTVK